MTVERRERVGHFVPELAPHEVVSAVASMFEPDERTRSSWSVPGRETTRFLRSEAKETSRMIDGSARQSVEVLTVRLLAKVSGSRGCRRGRW